MRSLCGRLAPSPTGGLHLGNAMTFLIAWLSVRSRGGRILLRIEDIQEGHSDPRRIAQTVRDLRMLGLDWDEGYPARGYLQSERRDIYRSALEHLVAQGVVYPCVCSRKDCAAADVAPHAGEYRPYAGTCDGRFKNYAEAEAVLVGTNRHAAWRFRVPNREIVFTDGMYGEQRVNPAKTSGDFVFSREACGAGYQLSVVVDDALSEVTEVVRGEDLLPSTPWQILLNEALGYPIPHYIHTPLMVDAQGRRLAKRHDAMQLAALVERGIAPERIVGKLAHLLGWNPEDIPLMPHDLIGRFTLKTIPRAPIIAPTF